ncbi:NACHT domain-containing protein [Aspergillus affinis]|uniref:NACHT domain-containing protein n=1 Tax=Aspergillus affinis TaxID=1070780 RepID=UPI0022FDCDAF|nr:uncharacterized protein KD926_000307 [Aspergillus affinis]KAI9037512.1 hypothetical protein KD926_000307 [Aspergillus affinis]
MDRSSQRTTGNFDARDEDLERYVKRKNRLLRNAHDALAQYYTKERPDLFRIERLSGEEVPIEQYFIDLPLIDTKWNSGGRGEHRFSDEDPFKVDDPRSSNLVISVEDLTKPRVLPSSTWAMPKRVLIRGHAGVGKTTLCRKILHLFFYGKPWQEACFSRLVWFSLEKAKQFRGPMQFLAHEFAGDKAKFESIKYVLTENTLHGTLVVFDGLEHIVDHLDHWQWFINHQTYVIVTSQPHAFLPSQLNRFDVEFQVVGFRDEQVAFYIQKMVPHSMKRSRIMDFNAKHPIIKEVLHIPVLLDIICSFWDRRGAEETLPTMTALYEEMEMNLWQRDLVRLRRMTRYMESVHRDPKHQIYGVLRHEIDFLRSIAFFGTYNDITEFVPDNRFKFQYQSLNIRDARLNAMSLLCSADSVRSQDDRDHGRWERDYYFLHPSFQHYFAAQCVVESWKIGKAIKSFDLESTQITVQPEELFRKERSNVRYDLMWQFVKGMLEGQQDKHSDRFWKLVQEKPCGGARKR